LVGRFAGRAAPTGAALGLVKAWSVGLLAAAAVAALMAQGAEASSTGS